MNYLKIGNIDIKGNVKVGALEMNVQEFHSFLTDSIAWRNDLVYNKNHFVSYNGGLFLSIVDNNVNNIPTDDDYWQVFSQGSGGAGYNTILVEEDVVARNNDELVVNIACNITLPDLLLLSRVRIITLSDISESNQIVINGNFPNDVNSIIVSTPNSYLDFVFDGTNWISFGCCEKITDVNNRLAEIEEELDGANEALDELILELESGSFGGSGGGNVIVDNELSSTSNNPVSNKVIYNALLGKIDYPQNGDEGQYLKKVGDSASWSNVVGSSSAGVSTSSVSCIPYNGYLIFGIPQINEDEYYYIKIEFSETDLFDSIAKTVDTSVVSNIDINSAVGKTTVDSIVIDNATETIDGFRVFTGLNMDGFPMYGLGQEYSGEQLKFILGDIDFKYFRYQWLKGLNSDTTNTIVSGKFYYGETV